MLKGRKEVCTFIKKVRTPVQQQSATKLGSLQVRRNQYPSHLPSIQSWGVFCSHLQVVRTVAQHYIEGVRERKLYFLFFKFEKW